MFSVAYVLKTDVGVLCRVVMKENELLGKFLQQMYVCRYVG